MMKPEFFAGVLAILILMLNHLMAQPLEETQRKALISIFTGLGCVDPLECKIPGEQEDCSFRIEDDLLIGCRQGFVTKIDLGGRVLKGGKLKGTISPSIGELTRLTVLTLNDHEITGMIPRDIAQLSHLTILRLQHNLLTGPVTPLMVLSTDTFICELQVAITGPASPRTQDTNCLICDRLVPAACKCDEAFAPHCSMTTRATTTQSTSFTKTTSPSPFPSTTPRPLPSTPSSSTSQPLTRTPRTTDRLELTTTTVTTTTTSTNDDELTTTTVTSLTSTNGANPAVTVDERVTETLAAVSSPDVNVAMIAGIAAGGGAFLCLAGIAACLLVRGRRKKKTSPANQESKNQIGMVATTQESNQQYGSLDLSAKFGSSGLISDPTVARAQAEQFDNDAQYVPVPADADIETISANEMYGSVPDARLVGDMTRASQYSPAAPALGSMATID